MSRSEKVHPSNLDLYNHDLYYGVLNDDGTVTPIQPLKEEDVELTIEYNNLLGRILLIIIAVPFIFKGVNQ